MCQPRDYVFFNGKVRSRILSFHEDLYSSLNDAQFTELLSQRVGIELSRECVRPGGLVIDIPKRKTGLNYAKKRVLVRRQLDGIWTVWLSNQ